MALRFEKILVRGNSSNTSEAFELVVSAAASESLASDFSFDNLPIIEFKLNVNGTK